MLSRPELSRPDRQRGFTLIEILVVIVIIAVMASMAVLALGNSGARAWTSETQRLAALLQLVADRALIDKAHYGVLLESDGYSVVRFEQAEMQWQPMDATGSPAARFSARQLPGNMRIEVLEEAQMPTPEVAEFAAEEEEEGRAVPQFVALSSGEVLPSEVAIFLLEDSDIARAAVISYTSLEGLKIEWQSNDY